MTTKTLVMSIIAAVAIIAATPIMVEAITGLSSTTVTTTATTHTIDFTLTGTVPQDGSVFGGYAVFTTSGDVIAVTSHPGAYDSETQTHPNKNRPHFAVCNNGLVTAGHCDATWHTHLVKPVANPLCQIAAIEALTYEQPSTVTISGNTITVDGVAIGTSSFTNSVNSVSTPFTAGSTHVSPNPVNGVGDGVPFDLVPVFKNGAPNSNQLLAICIGPAA